MSARRPLAVAFDVVETLFSLEPVAIALRGAGGGSRSLELFFSRLLRDAFALAAAGDRRPFRELAAAAAAFTLPDAPPAERDAVLAAFDRLPAQPDAQPALSRLAGAGLRAVALTNGGGEQTASLLQRAGLDRSVERTVSVEEVGRWKPAAEPYRHAAESLGVPPDRLALVSVHAWDVHGARRAGLVTGWASRLEGRFSDVFEPADVSGPDLAAVVEGLLALPGEAAA